MQNGDRVYYTHQDKSGITQKFPAIILSVEEDNIKIRIGRLNVATQKIDTGVFTVNSKTLSTRRTPCNYEEELLGE